jgi:hypothetical protein
MAVDRIISRREVIGISVGPLSEIRPLAQST